VGDPHRLRQILLNVTDNAVKFTDSGRVHIAVTRLAEDALRFEIVDSGNRVAVAARERVFEPFVQLDSSMTRPHGGGGLGLFLCRRLAAQMGEGIALDSGLGLDTAVWFTEPLRSKAPAGGMPDGWAAPGAQWQEN